MDGRPDGVTLRAMARDPGDRFPAAGALAEALACFDGDAVRHQVGDGRVRVWDGAGRRRQLTKPGLDWSESP